MPKYQKIVLFIRGPIVKSYNRKTDQAHTHYLIKKDSSQSQSFRKTQTSFKYFNDINQTRYKHFIVHSHNIYNPISKNNRIIDRSQIFFGKNEYS